MNSIVVVSKNLLAIIGSEQTSEFRLNQIRNSISLDDEVGLDIKEVYFCHLNPDQEDITKEQEAKLIALLNASPNQTPLEDNYFFITPRPGTISPWSSKATEILKNCDINFVQRIEKGMCYNFTRKFDSATLNEMGKIIFDRMTQEVFTNLHESSALFSESLPRQGKDIDIFSDNLEGLKKANIELGLALNADEIEYLYQSYSNTNKNPTDAELMMFAQANSEHCRHKIFNATWTIDGHVSERSLFDMIRNTHNNYSEGIISAYEDNAAILKGHRSGRFYPVDGKYSNHQEDINLVIKVETHNHPTAISPFSGASTGSGGEIRDEGATGVGAKPKAGLTGFSVSSLRIPKLQERWEFPEDKPERISSPLEIMIEAPIGAASFNNEFGRPNIVGYFRSFESLSESLHFGYHKPIMLAGGLGNIKTEHALKKEVPIGSKLIVLGGPAMLIGLGGGSASSLSSGEGDSDLDFASVQRENPEMERRCQEVLDRCWQEKNNPILFIHDVGAGGLSNAIPELVKDSGHGGLIRLRDIPNSEPGMTPMEVWCNESQERYVMAISEENLEKFSQICERERCPYAVVGEITSGHMLEVYDSHFDNYPISLSLDTLFGKPPKTQLSFNKHNKQHVQFEYDEKITQDAVCEVLRHPTVASKSFLITIGDRSITGLVARDQFVGPWQVPVSDYGLCKSTFSGNCGEAMAMGERTPLSLIDSSAAARISIAEVVTNILPSGIKDISDIKISANWMGSPNRLNGAQDLYEAVSAVGMELCPKWNIAIPVGKDSLSMTTEWSDDEVDKAVHSPLSLVASGFAPVGDISNAITPQLKDIQESRILFIDLGKGSRRMGGSILAQVNDINSGESPDLECIDEMPRFVEIIHKLLVEKKIHAYHDRSDGGLVTTLAEMSFAGRLGLNIDLSSVLEDEVDFAEFLFNEELGVVIQVSVEDEKYVLSELNKCSLKEHTHSIGTITEERCINFHHNQKAILSLSLKSLLENWHRVGFEIQTLRDNPATAESEFRHDTDLNNLGITPKINFSIPKKIDLRSSRPRIAILREQGVNGQNEMAAAFYEVGFDCIDVHMTDLVNKRHKLSEFQGLVACGGFSYGDVLGAGGGWANSILYDENLRRQFGNFFHDEAVFTLGVCNGCQALSHLGALIPGSENWPDFKRNLSEKFEARLIQVAVQKSPSIFFKGMEGSIIPVPVAHGEGRVEFSSKNKEHLEQGIISYVNDAGEETEIYPENPNGSIAGIAGVTNFSGTVTIMMPHPERAFLADQMSWVPKAWEKYSPWIKFFNNARNFIG